MDRIYLDNAATTAVRQEAVDAMLPFLKEAFANPSSPHRSGQRVKTALERARVQTAAALNARPGEIIFTGSGSEADSLAIFGIMHANAERGNHFITSAIEHHAVTHAADRLRRDGADVTILPVDGDGFVRAQDLKSALTDKTVLVSIMHANNEIGTIQPIAELAALAHERGAYFHTDAVQTVGHISADVQVLGVDALSLSAHKFEGPKGIAALYVRKGIRISPLVVGGGQENGRRAGTENVAGAAALATALEMSIAELEQSKQRTSLLRDMLIDGVLRSIPGTALNGPRERRIPNNASLRFTEIEADTLIIGLDMEGIEASTGSACTSGSLEPSHVLTAIGLDTKAARGTVRFSLGRTTTKDEIVRLLTVLPGMIEKLRAMARTLVAGP
ncbi:MAG TPA: IscS subfamily cysteine desulfurase [Candidatus Eremiobacteraceae bacterium]|nr:IscS subfamily cysteine desulfurase [Candidatus Eremiobacteraceae bacterium]